jgi:transglutaminase-like putative cysteine protease
MTGRHWGAVACVTGLAVVGGLSWHSAFGWSPLVVKVAAAALFPAVVAVLFRLARPQSTVAPLVVSFVLLCWFLAVFVLHDALVGVIPGPESVTGITQGVANGWDGILSVPLPVPALGEYVLVPVALTWIAAAFGIEIVLRTRHPLAGAVPVALNYGIALFFGIDGPGPRVGLAVLFVAGVLGLAGLSAKPIVVSAAKDRSVRTRRTAEVVACFLVVAGVASVVGPALPGVHSATPYNPRTSRVPPETPLATLNPLDELSQWAQSKPENLLQVRTDDPGPLRIAVLSNYDILNGWTQASRFEIAGNTLANMPTGSTKSGRETITIQHLVGPWLPAGLQPVTLNGIKAFVDPSTGVLISARPASGQEYQVTLSEPAGYQDLASPDCTLDAALPPPSSVQVPGAMAQLAQQYTSAATSPCQRANDLVAAFRQHFTFDAKAPSGSSLAVLENFALGSKSDGGGQGTEEQFAAAYALMADSLSMDARVVVGFYPGVSEGHGTYEIGPQDATAWVEIHFAKIGWVPFFPKPLKGGTPPNQQTDQQNSSTKPVLTPSASAPSAGPVREVAPPKPHNVSVLEVIGIVVAIALALLAALLLLAWLSVRTYRRRVQKRRRAETEARRRVLAAWSEAVDVLRDVGVKRQQSETAGELVVTGSDRLGADAGGALAPLARLSDAAQYAWEEPDQGDGDLAWQCAEDLSSVAEQSLTRWGRVRRALDVSALFHGRGR